MKIDCKMFSEFSIFCETIVICNFLRVFKFWFPCFTKLNFNFLHNYLEGLKKCEFFQFFLFPIFPTIFISIPGCRIPRHILGRTCLLKKLPLPKTDLFWSESLILFPMILFPKCARPQQKDWISDYLMILNGQELIRL